MTERSWQSKYLSERYYANTGRPVHPSKSKRSVKTQLNVMIPTKKIDFLHDVLIMIHSIRFDSFD